EPVNQTLYARVDALSLDSVQESQAGWQVVLEPCDGTVSQRFYVPQSGNAIHPKASPNLVITVTGNNSTDRTPLIVEPGTSAPGQVWTFLQFDTTQYAFPPVRATIGSYTFQGLDGKCI